MIEYALLIILGFCTAGLLAFLLAPTLWNRAVRLTTKRLEATMPMTLSEIEADKDLLRASYAIKIRRLEAGLNKARDKSANQLVEISKHQVQIAELNEKITELNAHLDERRNAANVFEGTIRKRFPELETMLGTASAALDERAAEISDINMKLRRREEALEMAQRSAVLQQEEIRQLRETLERTGTDITGRFKRRPSQWTLDEYRSEYDRLNVELSKMREHLIVAHDRENRQVAVLRTELQQLAERIMSTAGGDKAKGDWREAERHMPPRQEPVQSRAAPPPRNPAQPAGNPRPWTGTLPRGRAASRMTDSASRGATGFEDKPIIEARANPIAPEAPSLPEPRHAPASAAAPSEAPSEDAARSALKSLLDRGARLSGRELLDKADKAARAPTPNADAAPYIEDRPRETVAPAADAGRDPQPTLTRPMSTLAEPAVRAEEAHPVPKPEPQLDRVFREIIEGRAPAKPSGEEAAVGEAAVSERGTDAQPEGTVPDSKTKTLLDRLRHIQERQTG